MNRRLVTAALMATALWGCGRPATRPVAPLSVHEWKALPKDQKYTTEALERLKEGDPGLQTAEGWEAFSRSTLAEARKNDFPKGRR